jgi:hypothetical protein
VHRGRGRAFCSKSEQIFSKGILLSSELRSVLFDRCVSRGENGTALIAKLSQDRKAFSEGSREKLVVPKPHDAVSVRDAVPISFTDHRGGAGGKVSSKVFLGRVTGHGIPESDSRIQSSTWVSVHSPPPSSPLREKITSSLRDLPETVSGLVLHSHAIISHKLSLESNKPGPRQLGRRRILMASSFSTNSLPPVPRPNMTIIVPSSSRGRMFRSGRVICSLPKVTLSTKVKIGRIVRVQDSTVLWKLVNSQLWQPQEMGSSIKIFTSTVGDWYQVVAVIAQTCSFAERTINCTNPAV